MPGTVHDFAQRPEYRPQIDRLSEEAWPRFLLHGNMRHWHLLFDMFPDCQLLLCDSAGTLTAVGHTIPFTWSGGQSDLPKTMEEILIRAERAYRRKEATNTLAALAAMVDSRHRGQGLSGRVVQEMKALAYRRSCTALLAPVRPIWKSRYPLTPMERYVEWKRSDGAPLDPWIRVHWRLGAQPLCIAPSALTVEGTIEDWESWTDMAFPETGLYVISGALQPVRMDCEGNSGRYEDPNYWMKHAVGS